MFKAFSQKCYCGANGRYMNMVCGEYVWTCGKYGCLNPPKITTTDTTVAVCASQMTPAPDRLPDCRTCRYYQPAASDYEGYYPEQCNAGGCVNGSEFQPSEQIRLYEITNEAKK